MEQQQAGFAIKDWCAAVGIGRSTFYVLPERLRPRTAKLGKRNLVIEAPRAYLDRIADQGNAA